jgi:uncharacterized protein (TIGR04222 family)
MVGYAASGDTWGISGPTFLVLFGLAAVVAVIVVYRLRQRILIGVDRPGVAENLHPYEVAYLTAGPSLAVTSALGSLRTHGSVDTAGLRSLTIAGPMVAGATPLDSAIYNAIANERATTTSAVRADAQVRAALDELADRMRRGGLLLTKEASQLLRWATLPLAAVLGLGVFRLQAGLANDRPVLLLSLALLVVLAVELIFLVRGARRTKRGDRALAALREQYRHLAPETSPAWGLYGATGTAMAIGLFGGAALWSADPAFAADAELEQQRIQDSGSTWTGDTSTTGGGGGCSGGGGCGGGGGGCGGGCGG